MLTLALAHVLALDPGDAQLIRVRPGPDELGVTITVDDCLELDPANSDSRLRETVELRLGAGPEYRSGPGQANDTQILIDCGTGQIPNTVELTLIDPVSELTMTRTVELPPAEHRAERLGEQAAALVRAAWMTVALERPAARRRTRAEAKAARIARRASTPWELGDGFVVRTWLDRASPNVMLGEQVEVVHRPLRHLAWKADGELAFWRVPVIANDVRGEVATLTISAAPALLGWGELPGRGRRGAGTTAFYGGAGFRAGGVRMRSEAFGDSGGFRAFAGPLAMLRASVSLGRFVGLAINLEAGWALHGPERLAPQPGTADPSTPLSLRGPWTNGVLVIVSRF